MTKFIKSGVAVGCGWQAYVAYVNIGCYYIVGIPIGYVLGFTYDMGARVNFILHDLYSNQRLIIGWCIKMRLIK